MTDHQLVPHPHDEQPTSRQEGTERATDQLTVRAQQLQEQVFELEVQVRARPKIALAEGVLVERYGLPDADAAFALMRQASQRANIKLHQVAVAVARMPGPAQGASLWFGERPQDPAPPLTALGVGTLDARNQGEVLGAALRRVLEITSTHMGNVQLVEDGTLRMERHTGLPRQFTDHFAFVDGKTACSRAAVGGNQVTVKEVALSPGFDDISRRVILSAGSRGVHSVPLMDDARTVRGVISSHHPHPLDGFDRARLQALHRTSRAIGTWIDWHQRTVVLDALEDLHQLALARQK
ncbi:ANTAR domain-containing protein [Streptomyces sp. G5(2025)]|uniref:ANTAR domain-containing protein n=1 Tax=Streptomyces sp. G5(2025) TaxID=3406628 RepID=UPI003C25C1D4